jgi:tetratricopeptide (TPR) repeat protein
MHEPMSPTRPIVIFFAFANDRADRARYLRNLPDEQRHVREAMEAAVEAGLCEVVERANATVDEILDMFQDPEYRDRVAVFHFGGHAGDAELLLESAGGEATVAHAGGLARFLGEQRGLELVFLNGCSSRGQVQGLLDAGVPAVIATSQAIDDGVATEFSSRFYKALASGTPVRTAYAEAQGAVQMRRGDLARGTYRSFVPEVVAEDRWPWDLYVSPGAEERLARWSLPVAARDPLFGLPALPAMDLPVSPFKHLSWFGREDAPVFFGRGREIRDLYEAVTRPEAEPIVLLFGATGVGKSSLLAAGLAPRLEATHEVVYLRREGSLGQTLAQACGDWRAREAATGKPLVVILDQAEEAWTRPSAGGKELEDFAASLRSLFGVRESRPRGRLILGFRKEWLAEVLRLVDGEKLPRFRAEITHLDRDAVAEAIEGPARAEGLRRHFGLEVEPELADLIADDLLEDPGAAIAPALQILLTKMWALATQESATAPRFTIALYRRLKRDGILLDDFLGEQLEGLRSVRPDLVDSGLALDLLSHHTTALGTAETREAAEVAARYGGRPEVVELIRQCQDRYLLSTVATNESTTTRLAHDTLAPLVRRRFEASDLPGQRAARILQQRAADWAAGKEGPPLDGVDLATVEHGAGGMRAWTADETRLVEASRRERARRERLRRGLRWAAVLTVLIIAAAGGIAWRQSIRARKEARTADRVTTFLTGMLQELDPQRVALDENTLPQILDRNRKRLETDLRGEPAAQDRLRETIGTVYLNMGLYRLAEELLQQVAADRRRTLGEEHPDTLQSMSELAHLRTVQGRLREAEELDRRILASRRRVSGLERPETLKAMTGLANVVSARGRPQEAETLNRQALEIARRTLGEEHLDTLMYQENLANALYEEGRPDEAEKKYREVLAVRRRVQGEGHPGTVAALNNLAILEYDRGHLKEAEAMLRRALEINRRALGPEHPDTLTAMSNLATAFAIQNRLGEAEALQRQTLALRRHVLGEAHPATLESLNNLAALLRAQGHPQQGEELLRHALALLHSGLGDEHPSTLRAMNHLAGMLQEDGRLKEAEDLYRRTLSGFRRGLGDEHPETLWSMSNLAAVAQKQGRFREAEELFRKVLDHHRRVLGEKNMSTLVAMKNLADLYGAEGRTKEADELRERMGALYQQMHPE